MAIGADPTCELYHLPGFHEPFSAISHLGGAVLFLILGIMLVRRGWGDRCRVALLSVYSISCVLVMSMSGVYHMMVRGETAHKVLGRLDHAAIFAFIAGTFTPTVGILFRGWLRHVQLLLIWTAAITGLTLKSVFFDAFPEWLGLSFYLALGWLGAVTAVMLARRFGFAFVAPLVWGGLAYSVGAIADFSRWPTLVPRIVTGHEVFHVAVLAGALLHWGFIWRFADGGAGLHEQNEKPHAG